MLSNKINCTTTTITSQKSEQYKYEIKKVAIIQLLNHRYCKKYKYHISVDCNNTTITSQ